MCLPDEQIHRHCHDVHAGLKEEHTAVPPAPKLTPKIGKKMSEETNAEWEMCPWMPELLGSLASEKRRNDGSCLAS